MELKQRRRGRQGRRLVKNEFLFYKRKSQMFRSVLYANGRFYARDVNVVLDVKAVPRRL